MVRKEVTDIIRNHMRKLTTNIKNMAFENRTGDRIFVTQQDLFELRAICILAFDKLTGVDLQEEPFDQGGERMDKLDFYLDMLHSVQTALLRMSRENSLTALIAFTYGDLKDLEELLKMQISKEAKYRYLKEAKEGDKS